MADRNKLLSTGRKTPIYSVSWFHGPFNPIPTNIETGLTVQQIIDRVAPYNEPVITDRKDRLPYFAPCVLRTAELVGKTREKALAAGKPTVGVMRSSAHVTESAWFAFDLDDLTAEQYARVIDNLERAGVLYVAYSTFSHGVQPDLFRVRVLLFMDRAVTPNEWRQCWSVMNNTLLCGLADPQTGKVSQQAGVWAAHPERIKCAFRSYKDGALLSADALLALVPSKAETPHRVLRPVPDGKQVQRYADALGMLDASSYSPWLLGLGGLKGAVVENELTDDEAAALWFQFSDSGGVEAQTHNTDSRYNPEHLWVHWSPTVAPAPALIGRLFGAARNTAIERCKGDHKAHGSLTDEGLNAARYLARYHPRAFTELQQTISGRAA